MFGPAILDAHASEPVHDFSMHIDVAGDFYNDYEDYTMGDFELDDDGDGEEMVETSGEGGTDSDRDGDGDVEEEIKEIDIDVMAAEAETGLERRPMMNQHFDYMVERKNHSRTDPLSFNFQEFRREQCIRSGTSTKIHSTLQLLAVGLISLLRFRHKWSGRSRDGLS